MPLLATNYFPADGVQTAFDFAFAGVNPAESSGTVPYLYPEDVRASELYTDIDGNQVAIPRIVLISAPNRAVIVGAPVAPGRTVKIYRQTEIRFPLVDYRDRQSVSEFDLDLANRQAVFIAQETLDATRGQLPTNAADNFDAGGKRIEDLGDAIEDGDAVNLGQVNLLHAKTLRVPEDSVNVLPDVATRAGKLLSFNALGQPVAVGLAEDSATQLRLDLADDTGAGIVGTSGGSTVAQDLVELQDATLFTGTYDILVTYGQSNALGFAAASGDTSGYPAVLPTSLMYDPDSGTILPIIQGMKSVNGEVSTGHAWAEFANEYFRQTRRGLIVVNAARGGMPIATLSKGHASGYYTAMIAGANAAVASAAVQGLPVGKRFVCFHQGETDQLNNVSFATYVSALNTLISDINTDFPIELFGICTVGSPLTRLEVTWAQIQQAQRYVAQTNRKASLVFDGCPAFNIADGIINPNGTDEHYSQKGYNLMGFHAARATVALLDKAERVKSMADLAQYGTGVGAAWTRAQRVSALGFFSGGQWRVASRDTPLAGFRPAGISGVSSSGNTLSFKLSSPADLMFETYAKISQVAVMAGITPHCSLTVSGSDYYLDVQFYLDLSIQGNIGANMLFAGRPAAALPSWMSSFITSSVSANVMTLTHGATTQTIQCTHNGASPAFSGSPAALYAAADSATQSRLSFGTGTQPSSTSVNISIDRMLVPISALALFSGFAVEVGATVAPAN